MMTPGKDQARLQAPGKNGTRPQATCCKSSRRGGVKDEADLETAG